MKSGLLSFIVFGSISAILLFMVGSGIIGDLSAGAAHGAPETGYGFVFALILSPFLVVSLIVTVLAFRRFGKSTHAESDSRTYTPYNGPTIDSVSASDKNDPTITVG